MVLLAGIYYPSRVYYELSTMSYQQKKADSVDVGLLKEGDNAQFQFFSLPANPARLTFANGLLRVPTIYRRQRARKVTTFFGIYQKLRKSSNFGTKRLPLLGPARRTYQQSPIEVSDSLIRYRGSSKEI